MVLEGKEDQTAPVSEQDVANSVKTNLESAKQDLARKILAALNEKRDAYNGIVSSIIYVADSGDSYTIEHLKDELKASITINPMQYAGKMFATKALARLSRERPKFVIDLFEEIIKTTADWSKNFKDDSDILKLQVIAIKAIRQAEEQQNSRPTTISADDIYEICLKAANLGDDRTKIDTLNLVLACRSTTKPISQGEIDLYQILYKSALSLQEPALRQIFLSETGKFLFRLKESLRVMMRDKLIVGEDEAQQYCSRYNRFVNWLVIFSFENIYCNAYFGSFIITISTLKLVIQHINYDNPHLKISFLFGGSRCYNSLLSCLNDSFEENKAMALELLLALPINDEFINEANICSFEKIADELVTSVNPAHSLTCQYIFRLIIGLRLKQPQNTHTRNELLHRNICKLVELVEENIKETKEDFVNALSKKPIYPKLTCIRALLSDIEVENFDCNREDWTNLAKRVVTMSIEACQAVSAVVCNLNPETIGHLPMDLKPMSVDKLADTLKVAVNVSDQEVNTISSQMLLISGWKTIKECSLSLGAICIKFWWPKKTNSKRKCANQNTIPILQSEDIKAIIKFFDHYLRHLRHRGAFEQAYNGFMMVTQHIWQDEEYREVLVNLLKDIMDEFRNDALDDKRADRLRAYVTRRSAGLPFIVQAILNSEHEHDSQTLRMVMKCLFEVLESPNSVEFQKIHCLNILKALTKERCLGEKMLSFIGPIFNVALDSFKSDSFSIRNCASMLLKAAVDRTFGINRLSDAIHRRNQLSFERFFASCPGLHKKMLNHLNDGLLDKKHLASVHAVFIILFRLVPSIEPSDEYSHEKMIHPFVKPTTQLAFTCKDFKLREIAAKSAVRLRSYCMDRIDDTRIVDADTIIDELGIAIYKSADKNRLHGALAMVKHWIECTSLPREVQEKFDKLGRLVFGYVVALEDFEPISKTVALEIAESLLLKHPSDCYWLTDLHIMLVDLICERKPPTTQKPYYETFLFKSIILILMGVYDEYEVEGDDGPDYGRKARIQGLNKLLKSLPKIISQRPNRIYSFGFQASLIRLIRQLLSDSQEQSNLSTLLDKLDMDLTAGHSTPYDKLKLKVDNDSERERWSKFCYRPKLKSHVKTVFSCAVIMPHTGEICDTHSLGKYSVQRSNTPRAVESFALAYELDEIKDGDFSHEPNSFLEIPDCDVKCVALLYYSKLARASIKRSSESTQKYLGDFCNHVRELSEEHRDSTIRTACSMVLQEILVPTVHSNQRQNRCLEKELVNLFSSLVKLCQDEDAHIRERCHRIMLDLPDFSRYVANTTKMGSLINYISDHIYDPSAQGVSIYTGDEDLVVPTNTTRRYFGLMMEVLVNNSNDSATNSDQERNQLFDKTKLNTFADRVSTIYAVLEALQTYFARSKRKVTFELLDIPPSVKRELGCVIKTSVKDCGDYRWNRRKHSCTIASGNVGGNETHENLMKADERECDDNFYFFEQLVQDLDESLEYFNTGYLNMLTEPEYTHHELLLLEQVAFVKFVTVCTNFRRSPIIEDLLPKIREKLRAIAANPCSTIIFIKIAHLLI